MNKILDYALKNAVKKREKSAPQVMGAELITPKEFLKQTKKIKRPLTYHWER